MMMMTMRMKGLIGCNPKIDLESDGYDCGN
jgi:hypothetical protein